MAVAVDPNHAFKPFSKPPRCKLPSYSQLDYTMLEPSSQSQSIKHHACELKPLHRSLSTPCLSINSRPDNQKFESNSRIEIIGGHRAPRARALVVEVGIAMASGALPEPVSTGLGGAYFLKSQNGDIVAVAKPMDEEPLALNNPKGFADHPWIKEDGEVPDTPLDNAILERLKQFRAMNKFKKVVLRVIAGRLSEEEIMGLKQMFKGIDVDNNGTTILKELKQGLAKQGTKLSEYEVKQLMKAAYADGNGTIDLKEMVS